MGDDFHRLVEEHYDRIFRAARFMCGDPAAAEDLVQETFLAAATGLKRFKGRSSTYTWLYSILLNKFRRWVRRKRRRTISLEGMADSTEEGHAGELLETQQPSPGEEAERREAAQMVRKAIEGLTPDHRVAVTLRYVEGMPYGAIAELLGCPVGTVKSRIHYALQKIGRFLTQGQGPPD